MSFKYTERASFLHFEALNISTTLYLVYHMAKDTSEGGTPDTVGELFSKQRRSDPDRDDLVSDLADDEWRQTKDWFEQAAVDSAPGSDGRTLTWLSTWTLGTVMLALVTSLLLGFLTIDAGSTTMAFLAGVLSGGSGILLGLGLLAGTARRR